ncbi:hypothetical protein MBLNU459_g5511t1, partial [Dothideomycetes sp. NU459]
SALMMVSQSQTKSTTTRSVLMPALRSRTRSTTISALMMVSQSQTKSTTTRSARMPASRFQTRSITI